MRPPRTALLCATITLAGCRAGAREGLGPTGIPFAAAPARDPAAGPASLPSKPSPGRTVWKAEYYQISDG